MRVQMKTYSMHYTVEVQVLANSEGEARKQVEAIMTPCINVEHDNLHNILFISNNAVHVSAPRQPVIK